MTATERRNGGALASGEEFRVTEELPGDVRLCRIRTAADECWGCVALLADTDQRAGLSFLADAANAYADQRERIAALEAVLRSLLTTNSYVQGVVWQGGVCFYCGCPWHEDGDNHAADCLLLVSERLLSHSAQ